MTTGKEFATGVDYVWLISGHARIRVTRTGGANGVVSGLLLRRRLVRQPSDRAAPVGIVHHQVGRRPCVQLGLLTSMARGSLRVGRRRAGTPLPGAAGISESAPQRDRPAGPTRRTEDTRASHPGITHPRRLPPVRQHDTRASIRPRPIGTTTASRRTAQSARAVGPQHELAGDIAKRDDDAARAASDAVDRRPDAGFGSP